MYHRRPSHVYTVESTVGSTVMLQQRLLDGVRCDRPLSVLFHNTGPPALAMFFFQIHKTLALNYQNVSSVFMSVCSVLDGSRLK